MASLPRVKVPGQKVWSRILRQDPDHAARAADAKLRVLRLEVERVAGARSQRERAAQLARVMHAVTALAEAHGLSQAELDALRAGSPVSVAGLKRQLKQRASGVVAQVWSVSMPLAARGQEALGLTPRSLASALIKRELKRVPFARKRPLPDMVKRARSPFVLRVGRPRGAGGPQLIAASLLHLPRLQRQMLALRRSADAALSTAMLVRLPHSPIGREHVAAAGELLRSGRSGLQLTYEVASAGAQLFLRSYLFPRVLRYLSAGLSSSVAMREVVNARVLPPTR